MFYLTRKSFELLLIVSAVLFVAGCGDEELSREYEAGQERSESQGGANDNGRTPKIFQECRYNGTCTPYHRCVIERNPTSRQAGTVADTAFGPHIGSYWVDTNRNGKADTNEIPGGQRIIGVRHHLGLAWFGSPVGTMDFYDARTKGFIANVPGPPYKFGRDIRYSDLLDGLFGKGTYLFVPCPRGINI